MSVIVFLLWSVIAYDDSIALNNLGAMMVQPLIIDQRQRDLGGGFIVGRVLPFARQRMVGPFIFLTIWGLWNWLVVFPRS